MTRTLCDRKIVNSIVVYFKKLLRSTDEKKNKFTSVTDILSIFGLVISHTRFRLIDHTTTAMTNAMNLT